MREPENSRDLGEVQCPKVQTFPSIFRALEGWWAKEYVSDWLATLMSMFPLRGICHGDFIYFKAIMSASFFGIRRTFPFFFLFFMILFVHLFLFSERKPLHFVQAISAEGIYKWKFILLYNAPRQASNWTTNHFPDGKLFSLGSKRPFVPQRAGPLLLKYSPIWWIHFTLSWSSMIL